MPLKPIFTLLILFTRTMGLYTEKVTECSTFECGEKSQIIKQCKIEVKGLVRVDSIDQVDSYNCRCTEGGSFGIAHGNRSIFVFNFCCGLFNVCFTKELPYDTGPIMKSPIADTTTLSPDATSRDYATTIITSERPISGNDEGEDMLQQNDQTQNKRTKPNKLRTTPYPLYLEQRHLSETDKYFLILGIIVGGLILIVIIVATAFLCFTGRSKPKEKHNKSPKRIISKTFRNHPSLSTTELLSSEFVATGSPLYDIIPHDQMYSEPLDSFRFTQNTTTLTSGLSELDIDSHLKHTYFKLLPETCKFCPTPTHSDKMVGAYSHAQPQGIYDQLQTHPKPSVPDSATYSHLHVCCKEHMNIYDDIATRKQLDNVSLTDEIVDNKTVIPKHVICEQNKV